MSAESPAASGHKLGRYLLERRIASGGMADVYLARLVGAFGFSRRVAVKVLKSDVSSDPDNVRMFLREAMLAAEFNHPHLAQVYEVAEEGGRLYIAMELVRGISLTTLMVNLAQKGKSIPIPLATRIARDVLDGLSAAHEAVGAEGQRLDLVHRDVTPHNILVDVTGGVKLVDFGIARAETRAGRTQGAQIKGKFGYMAPEQWESSRDVDARADLFSLGVVLYEATTGSRRLFRGNSAPELYKAIVKDTIPPPTLRVPEYPNTLSTVVMRALERDPNARWPSALAMRDALDRVLEAEDWLVTPDDLAELVNFALDGRSIEERWEALATGEAPAPVDVDDVAKAALAAVVLAHSTTRPRMQSVSSATVSARPSALGLTPDNTATTPSHTLAPVSSPRGAAAPRNLTVWMGAALAGWLVALAVGATWWRTRSRLLTMERNGPVVVSPLAARPRELPAPMRVLSEAPLAESLAAPWAEVLTAETTGLRVEVDRGNALARMIHGEGAIALRAGLADDRLAAEGRTAGLELRVDASQHVVGFDHAVVIVHPNNPLPSLSVTELAALFAGRATSYHGFHGARETPTLVVCGAGAPTRAFLDDVVMPLGDARRNDTLAERAIVVVSEAAAVERVASDATAIALVRLAFVNTVVRVVPIEREGAASAVPPTRDTIRSGQYPLVRPVVLYTRGAPMGHEARLLEIALSPTGQTLLERAGYVSR